jgi:integrase
MGTVFRKAWTAPLPPGAEVVTSRGKRVARWRLRNGKLRTAEVFEGRDGSLRIRGRTAAYVAKYRDRNGVWVEAATGCKDETAARAILGQLERRAELIRAGVMTPEEDDASRHGNQPIAEHIEAWKEHLRLKGSTEHWWTQAKRRVIRVCSDRGVRRLRDLNGEAVERWLRDQADAGMSAGTRNGYRRACVSFANWCVRTNRLASNPLDHVAMADERASRRRTRRALTDDELTRLLDAARRRPLAEALTIRRGKAKGKRRANLTDATRARLDRTGRERALIYKTLVLTGLRKGELASVTVGQIDFDGPVPYLILEAKDEKNRQGSEIPVRADLAGELRAWLDEKLIVLQDDARHRGDPIPTQLPPTTKMLDVPDGLIRIFDRDLVFAGIARVEKRNGKEVVIKTDERGRTIDIHALRHTFGTHLCRAGVPLRTAQAAMRHSDPSLTANVYTDPKLLDVAGALEALPALSEPGQRSGGGNGDLVEDLGRA